MVSYRLDDLGWLQFERMCQTLLKHRFGAGVEAWGGSGDLGRDAYYTGSLELLQNGVPEDGPFVFQAKFVGEANAAGAKPGPLLMKAVGKECAAIRRRLARNEIEPPRHWILLTNVPRGPAPIAKVKAKVATVLPEATVTIWCADDLSAMLDDAPNVRTAFPQVLGLRNILDLITNVLGKTVLTRSRLAIKETEELAEVFVPVEAYSTALRVLDRHNIVVLTGPPEVGKTAIARMVGLGKASAGWQVVDIGDPADFYDLLEEKQPQIFIADDAFGTTEYEPDKGERWARELPRVLRGLDQTHLFVWTSRKVILQMALREVELQGAAEHFPDPGEIAVDVSAVTEEERALMLYRHAKAGTLSAPIKRIVRQNARQFVIDPHFTPERVRRFIRFTLPEVLDEAETQSLTRDQIAMIVAEEIRNPTERMRRHFERLPATHQSFLIAMLDVASNTSTVDLVNESYYRHSADQSVPPKTVARDLQGTAIRPLTVHSQVWSPRSRVYEDTHRDTYVWVHPSWRDMVIERLAADDATRAAFVSNCALPGLLLALSTAGGAKGERETPLLRAAEDWDALISRAAALIDNETDDVAHRILSATHGIVARAAPKGALTDGLLRLATAVLSACREAWALSAVCACDRQS